MHVEVPSISKGLPLEKSHDENKGGLQSTKQAKGKIPKFEPMGPVLVLWWGASFTLKGANNLELQNIKIKIDVIVQHLKQNYFKKKFKTE